MHLRFSLATLALAGLVATQAVAASGHDSITVEMDEIVLAQKINKENIDLRRLPLAVSYVSSANLQKYQANSLKDISSFVPNFFIPEYGSKLTSPIYIRGVGSRMGAPSATVYVDGIPYLNQGAFDFEFFDIAGVQVLRGPQGTLYGRNSMAGIVNIYSQSPFYKQGTRLLLSSGNYGYQRYQATHQQKMSDKLALSVGANYHGHSGFFTNEYTGRKADAMQSAAGRARLVYQPSSSLKFDFTSNYEWSDQDGYAYGRLDTTGGQHQVLPVNYNDPATYRRHLLGNSLLVEYKGQDYMISSITGYQWLDDKMQLDQDFTPASIFTLTQKQRQHGITQEVIGKSTHEGNYQWMVGLFGFYDHLTTEAPVTFLKDGISMIEGGLIKIPPSSGYFIKVIDETVLFDGRFKTPSLGGALFHQSTYNNLVIEGLSVTAGIRFDVEQNSIDYYSNGGVTIVGLGPVPLGIRDTIFGKESMTNMEFLPKLALKYDINMESNVYATVAKGYKAGGYNIQMFSDILQGSLRTRRPGTPATGSTQIEGVIDYRPEWSWNYEVGARGSFFDKRLSADAALFYIDTRDLQMALFADNGFGRMMKNAGRAVSKGAELSLQAYPVDGLTLSGSYGYTHATFSKYQDTLKVTQRGVTQKIAVDYAGHFVPMSPRHTASVAACYTLRFSHAWLQSLALMAQYTGAGKFYWTERNDVYQNYYGTVNAQLSYANKYFEVSLWSRNLLNEKYYSFYFANMGQSFLQQGRPLQYGVDLRISF